MITCMADVVHLVEAEYQKAQKEHRPLASIAEGYAVLLEEVEETEEALQNVRESLKDFWSDVRSDVTDDCITVAAMKACAMRTACEAIQVAAVCTRILDICGEGSEE